ncbi:hypothetical protein [Lichenifustis flavocetrariae]|uniref:Uncharacterized protein n=1 Tax=Lichenifustis flavocetrariae TaxID=2949735 RepID=A0AA42CJ87_9HYPH|nr:hypothetical protein [Lichenifustis flavocetrariae]MCW6509184.1 hypothetical protein [Lichenifustis flavocetrariae]
MGRAACEDEGDETPKHPAERDITSSRHDSAERDRNRAIGETDRGICERIAPKEFRPPNQADSMRRQTARIQKLEEKIEHRRLSRRVPMACEAIRQLCDLGGQPQVTTAQYEAQILGIPAEVAIIHVLVSTKGHNFTIWLATAKFRMTFPRAAPDGHDDPPGDAPLSTGGRPRRSPGTGT